jgi:hypothetical protein
MTSAAAASGRDAKRIGIATADTVDWRITFIVASGSCAGASIAGDAPPTDVFTAARSLE